MQIGDYVESKADMESTWLEAMLPNSRIIPWVRARLETKKGHIRDIL